MTTTPRLALTPLDVLQAYNVTHSQEKAAALLRTQGHAIRRSRVGEILREEWAKVRLDPLPPPPVERVDVVAPVIVWQPRRDIISVPCLPYSPLVSKRREFWMAYDFGWAAFIGGCVIGQRVPDLGGIFALVALLFWFYATEV